MYINITVSAVTITIFSKKSSFKLTTEWLKFSQFGYFPAKHAKLESDSQLHFRNIILPK